MDASDVIAGLTLLAKRRASVKVQLSAEAEAQANEIG